MNKIMTFLFILLISECNAATGNANDGQLMAVIVIGIILLIVGTGYFIDFMKCKIKELKKRILLKKNRSDQDSEFLNSFIKTIPELDRISTY